MENNIRKHKELLETKKRVNELKLKQMKAMNEKVASGEDHGEGPVIGEFDPRGNDQMIKTNHGMQVRYHP